MTPSTSPSTNDYKPIRLRYAGPKVSHRIDSPMLCLYKPYSFNRSAAGGRAVPVRGILFTVFKAWTKTRSATE